MFYLRYFIFLYLIILLSYKANSAEVTLRCLVFLEENDTSAQSVSVVKVDDDQHVDKIKWEIKKKWPRLEKYNPDQITLRKMNDKITTKKLITSFYNDKVERGVEMIPVNSISVYFPEGSPMDCENCIDIAVYLRREKRDEL
ncbi:unnamed protein product [Rhizophagus irregularis]|uniref:Crinkler effector protein N-terminal domain-containing protein n=1 Tax=Rhizophagus irregularis TaxID=588596 RepID=A0A2I1DXN1_9GLOM|nr:hypothetical protein RhiirB3_426645 [Rhizophagus irregularis]CAB4491880.1 unnamed protein product [Rhizophagus irregularis]CAB5126654.1 unnamed protein product [Rhizophagus irregularis]CAB5381385.1 unnamed protein product [Rhizophagus irregularis]